MRILWIGHGTHRPAPDFPFMVRDGFYWHYSFPDGISLYQYLIRDVGHFIGELAEYNLTGNSLLLRGNPVDLTSIEYAFFSWNCLGLREEELERWMEIENFIRRENPSIIVLNSMEEFTLLNFKTSFFERIRRMGLQNNVPEFEAADSLFSTFISRLPYPLIVRSNMDTGGRHSYLCHSRLESLKQQLSIRKGLSGRKRIRQERCGAPDIVRVLYYDNLNTDIGCHTSFRIIFLNGRIGFIYPHVSMTDWCIHTDMKENSPPKASFIKACEFIYDFVGKNPEKFRAIAREIKVHTLAIDFLVFQGRPIFLEAELKYGCDINFIQGPLKRYKLELAFFRAKLEGIEPRAANFESFFCGEKH